MEMRGLTMFISEVRRCTSKEQEEKRIEKELAKIRGKFKTDTKMLGYDRKKHITKLLYVYMLGYEIDFGHMEAIKLLSSDVYSEKHIGYLACTLLLNENHELLTLITNSIKQDLASSNENFQCLALTAIANVGGKEFAEVLAQDVQKILVSADTKTNVRKKAALCLLRLFRKYPEILPPDAWSERVINLLSGRDLGVVTSVMGLLQSLVARNPSDYEGAVPRVVKMLTKIVINREFTNDYVYYGVPTPWLQVKLLRLLQSYAPPTDPASMSAVSQVLNKIIGSSEIVKSVNRNNATHSVLFEAIGVAIAYDNDRDLLANCANLLGRYIGPQVKEANLRYLALDTMARLAMTTEGETIETIKKHENTIIAALKDADISLRRRALDLLFSMCDRSNAAHIVEELLTYLQVAEFTIREELVLKIAILAEKFAADLSWYLDVILNVIATAGDFVSEDIWHRAIQIVTNNEDLQKYAADTVLKAVKSPAAHENAVRVGGYILGEFGHLIVENPEASPLEQFMALHSKFHISSTSTRTLLLNTYIKFFNMFEDPGVRARIMNVFEQFRDSIDAEMQQRANEYFTMANSGNEDLMSTVFETMPLFPDRESSVARRIKERQSGAERGSGGSSGAWKSDFDRGTKSDTESPAAEPDFLEPAPSASVAAPVAPASSGNMLDLDDLLGAPAPAPVPVRTAPAPAPALVHGGDLLDDLLGGPVSPAPMPTAAAPRPVAAAPASLDDMFSTPVAAAPVPSQSAEDEAAKADSKKKFSVLVAVDNGVVYEDARLQIGIKSEIRGALARYIIFFGNKSAGPMTVFSSTITGPSQLKLTHSQTAPMIAPRTQLQQYLSVECAEAFSGEVTLNARYENNGATCVVTARLPVVVSKFFEPVQLSGAEEFFSQWKAIPAGPGLTTEVVSVFKAAKPIDMAALSTVFATGFRLAVLQGVDPNPANFVLSSRLNTTSGVHSVLARVETNAKAQAFRLTVRSANGQIPETLKNLLVTNLGEQTA